MGFDSIVLGLWKKLNDDLHEYLESGRNNKAKYFDLSGYDNIKLKILQGKKIFRLYADRDISCEYESSNEDRNILCSNGEGATNLVRLFLNSELYDRRVIQEQLLNDLNLICNPDAYFTDIICQFSSAGDNKTWEIKLVEDDKGDIPLSASGSGLKTVILVLLFLRCVVEKEDKTKCIFAFEELENNLHPAMQKRLFHFIEKYAMDNKCLFFITTHSNVVVDMFAGSDNAQIVHVTHDRKSSRTRTVSSYIDQKNVLDDIGAKASDLLMSNGIIWVEGPSDRIYFNKWLELFSPDLKEGSHFEYAYFGGSNIASFSASVDECFTEDKINLLKVNKNAIILVDSDVYPGRSDLKPNVKRVKMQSEEMGIYFWETKGREVENYLPVEALTSHFDKPDLPKLQRYARFFNNDDSKPGYYQEHSGNKTFNKVKFANDICQHFTKENLSQVLDLEERMADVVDIIKKWNEG